MSEPVRSFHRRHTMGGTKRTRSGRDRVNSTSTSNSRQKEEAELRRVVKLTAAIPSYSGRFQLFRQNRRQKAREIVEQKENSPRAADLQPAVFRATRFSDLPISRRTLDGLVASGFTDLTSIQRNSIPQSLAGRDVLAAAPTGSGKTLAFLVPLLEVLWRNRWNTLDGPGAIVLSPTRELSMQIFEVLRSIARGHAISAGLVIGGKDFEGEREKVGNMNVLVATPGRLLHHMDHVAELDCSAVQMLILDEADRILDMGFAKTLDAILMNLPKSRQTLLFSATQTKSIKSLARLSLREPEYVAVSSHEVKEQKDGNARPDETVLEKETDGGNVKIVGTPRGLSQSYSIVPAHSKLSVLWSFLKTHLKSKILVFFSSGKQVRFAFETFCKLRPGMSLLHLHGGMKQVKRADMYDLFCRTKAAALFATDVASRGLDFPDVEWVIQVDCPDDVSTYVHRVGRTARFKSNGRAMLLLNHGGEESFLNRLSAKNISLSRARVNPTKITSIDPRLAATVASNQELKHLAQRAFTFYVKSVYQKADKEVFNVADLDFTRLARSFGLSVVPKVSIKHDGGSDHASIQRREKAKTVFGYQLRTDPVNRRDGQDKDITGVKASVPDRKEMSLSDDGDILTIKKVHKSHRDDDSEADAVSPAEQKKAPGRKTKKRKLDLLKGMPSANRIVYNSDGIATSVMDLRSIENEQSDEEAHHAGIVDYARTVSMRLENVAAEDKMHERGRVRSIHARQRARRRELNRLVRPQSAPHQQQIRSTEEGVVGSDSETFSSSDEDPQKFSVESRTTPANGSSLAEEERLAALILKTRR